MHVPANPVVVTETEYRIEVPVIQYVEVLPKPIPLTQLENTQMTIKKILAFEEGFRRKPYLCSAGYVTIGYGTKLHKRKGMKPENFPLTITELAGTEMLNDDISEILEALDRSKYSHIFSSLSQARQNIIISMSYQLGVTGVLKFKKTWGYLGKGDFNAASIEMLDSKWHSDTPERANRHSVAMQQNSMVVYNKYF
jgi:lysozyme